MICFRMLSAAMFRTAAAPLLLFAAAVAISTPAAAQTQNCFSLAPTSAQFGPAARTGLTVSVTAATNCVWTSASSDSFLTITSGSGTGSGTVVYSIAANNGASSRRATISVTGRISFGNNEFGTPTTLTSTVDQSGNPLSVSCGPCSGQVGVATSAQCTASGGLSPYIWTLSGGVIPPGMSLTPTGGAVETISGTPTTAGSFNFSLRVNDFSSPLQTASANLTCTISPSAQTSSTTTLTVSPSPSAFGQNVTLTAAVSPNIATGTVTFFDGTATIGSATVANGSASMQISSLAIGTHPLSARYGGESRFTPSSSNTVNHTVGATATSISLSASPTSASPGQTVTFTATVNPANSTGTVTFRDGGSQIGSANLGNGTATFSTSGLAVGTHSITASYGGDSTHSGSTSNAVTVTIGRTPTNTSLAASPNPASPGQTVTMVASVGPSGATGTVTFLDGGAALGSVALANGSASFSTAALGTGSHSLTASYSGDNNFAPSVSAAVIEVVGGSATSTSLSASPTSAAPGQAIALTATVNPSNSTGSVTFFDGTASIGTASLANGTASLSVSSLSNGAHSLTAFYNGDTTHDTSRSSPVNVVIGQGSSAVSLSAFPNPANTGQQVTLTALVTPASATGTVTFRDGTNAIGTVALTNGGASLTTTFNSIGNHSLSASYSGDNALSPSSSNAVTEVITQPSTGTTTDLRAVPNPAVFGLPVALTATVSPATATGTVAFLEGNVTLGTASLNNGVAIFTTSTLRVGSHLLQASYNGGGGNNPSQSGVVTLLVNAAPTTTTLTVNPASSNPGQAVTFTATVSPAAATGSITFRDGAANLSTVTLANGTATFSTSNLSAGNHTVTAVYAGDGNFAASTSSPVTAAVGLASTTTTLLVAPLSSAFGQPVTFTATVSPASVTGTVSFRDGSTTLNTATLSGGTATFTTSALTAGTHTLTAAYNGDSTNGASTSSAVTATVGRPASTTVLTVSPSPSNPAQAVTLSARVTPASATGTVTFLDGQATLGTGTLASGVATFTTSSLAAGSHTLTAAYGGDDNTAASTSAAVTHTVASATPVQISSPAAAAPGFVGTAYSQTFLATGGTTPYTWSVVSGNVPGLNITTVNGTGVLAGTPTTAGTTQLTVRVQDAAGIASAGVFTLTVHPLPNVSFTVTQPSSTADQPAPRLTLAQAYPFAVTGTFTLTFAPNAAALPAGFNAARFLTGGTTVQVTIPANSTTPTPAIPAIQLGTVAGDIVGTLGTLTVAGSTQTVPFPGQAPNVRITVPRLAPSIVAGSVRITNVTGNGFQVTLDASSTPRDLTSGAFTFAAASGAQLAGCTPNCTVQLGTDATAWFTSTNGVNNGGAFSLTFPFTFSGDTSAIGSATVTLTNSAGTSAAVSGGR